MFNIKQFGAIGDGIHDDTAAVKAAIDACRAEGGGMVVVPPGQYSCTPLELFSYVNLHLEPGSVLLASPEVENYHINNTSAASSRAGLIRAVNAKSFSITGTGTIHCQGMKFMDETRPRVGDPGTLDYVATRTRQKEKFRAMDHGVEDGPAQELERPGNPLQFMQCENVTLRDIVILDSPNWTIHFHGSNNIVISGMTIKNNILIPNSDGIHFQNCSNVRVSDCYIECGDDSFAFTGYGPEGSLTENVLVTNCTLISRSSAIRVGYGKSDMKNMLFNNIIIRNSNRGIGVFQRDAGAMENIVFSNIVIETRLHTGHWWGHGEPIHVSSVKHNSAEGYGTLKQIRFSNILAKGEAGMLVYGCPDSVIEDVVFDNVRFDVLQSKLADRYGGNIDLRPIDDIEFGVFEHHECGLYAENVRGLKVHNFQLHWEGAPASYFQHGIEVKDCEDVVVDGFAGKAPQQSETSLAFHADRSRGVTVRNSDDVGQDIVTV
ncbi:glycoside hydrolase family 28 protein [Paenibacillus montanisoli]|uniref:Rhamnogalacturonase A/B/Epimerase-like pectate lyase domain-containing protein n=1 Tax=Paenibacillus montanisoli TaxID=2081970 RepID=A0A328U4X2_9BACL|nr:glycosyl hydrolase family 28 protein [Paenibacillus montanisoli]RAP77898.1 hypothetical protein DL346_05430 [Paenibacillus montanisoli]